MKSEKQIRSSLETASRQELIFVIEMLLSEVKELRREIDELKNKNSRNSSLPPSKDKQSDKRKTKSLREKSNRKTGGQQGHQGRTLKMIDEVDHQIDYQIEHCTHCDNRLTEGMGSLVERKQVWDIPPVALEVTEHRRYKKCCDKCSKWSTSEFGNDLDSGPPIRYGDRLLNQLVYLSVRQLIPYKRLAEAVELLYGQKISQGTIDNMLARKAEQVSPVYDQIINEIASSKVVGVDESGCSVKGQKAWAWTWVTPKYSLIHISDNRGYRTTESLFPQGFPTSILNSDCWKAHLKTDAKGHQICIPHLRRECQGLIDFHNSKWARKMDAVLKRILMLCRMGRINSGEKQKIEKDLDALLAWSLSRSAHPVKSLKNRLLRLRECLTICLYDRKVPPDNNASERAIRMIKLKVKISGTFRSEHGAHRFAKLRTIVDSAIKQALRPLDALANPQILIPPS